MVRAMEDDHSEPWRSVFGVAMADDGWLVEIEKVVDLYDRVVQ